MSDTNELQGSKSTYPHMAKVYREKATVFREYHEKFGDDSLGMSTPTIDAEPTCGTIACVGGWLAHHYQTTTYEAVRNKSSLKRDFNCGADAFANELGFNNLKDLEDWAYYHPKLWGNDHGEYMFAQGRAYSVDDRRLTLTDVANHWDAVADRLDEAYNEL